MAVELISRERFRHLADVAIAAARGDHAWVSLSDRIGGTARFANNQITQNIDVRRWSLSVGVAFGHKRGSATTTDLSERAIVEAVRRAEKLAELAPEDPEFMPPVGPQTYPVFVVFRPETAEAGPARRTALAGVAIRLCREAGLVGAGIVATRTVAVGVAASTGLFAYEQRTRADFSLTATAEDSSGWVRDANRSIDDIDIERLSRRAIEKAQISARPREIPAGWYTVVLEPAAVAGLIGPLISAMNARAYDRGTTALAGRLGEQIIDPRLTLRNRPDHASLLSRTFDGQGLPADVQTWIEDGVLRRLYYDRFTAQEHGTAPSYPLDCPHLSVREPAASIDALIAGISRGVLVTNFWYIRPVNRVDLTLTGMTRDGTLLIEAGRIAGGVKNFRFHDSPLRAFAALEAATAPTDAITLERTKMMLPAMRIADFHFSSVTRF